jgi:predicted nucleic acid-binding protein
MKRGYIDTSVLVALHFGQTEARRAARILRALNISISVNLVVPELLATLKREGRPLHEADRLLARIALYSPTDSLRPQCEAALAAGSLRGADLWHVAAALAIAGPQKRSDVQFVTFDERQQEVARSLGFSIPK